MKETTHKKKKERLSLTRFSENLRVGTKKNGVKYTVRDDRRRYFFPKEWKSFIELINDKQHKFFFITLLHTGARIMEVLNLKHEDIDTERETITIKVVKQRKAKRNFSALGKSRSFFVASNFIKEYKSFIRNKTINPKEYIFLDNSKLPKDYSDLDNKDKKKYYAGRIVAYSKMLKGKLKKAGIEDYYNFSPHNIRKTYGNVMRSFNIKEMEICYRLGNDMDTFMNHYGSSLIFSDNERREWLNIFGEVK